MSARASSLACAAALFAAAAVAPVAACDGETQSVQFGEPIRVRGAQFVKGDLPGTPPPATTATGDTDASVDPNGPPAVTAIQALSTVVYPGEGGKALSGRATSKASSVAIRFADMGTGYWVLPIGAPDPLFPGELTWSAPSDFDPNDPPGKHPLLAVAIDANGVAGVQSEQTLCLASAVPDNLESCDPTRNPPEAVITLKWNADVDLDLHVISPSGRDINPKAPLVYPVDAGVQPSKNDPVIDHDSLAACVPDGRRQENLVFQGRPTGTWQIYVNEYNACGKPAVTFTVSVYEPEGTLGQGRHLVQTFTRSGRLLDVNADGDSSPGLFVAEYPFD
jgi:hypothetical protein